MDELPVLQQVAIPWFFGTLYSFCDSSSVEYAAVVYVRLVDTLVSLLGVKTKFGTNKDVDDFTFRIVCGSIISEVEINHVPKVGCGQCIRVVGLYYCTELAEGSP
jgi:hypothetical protein